MKIFEKFFKKIKKEESFENPDVIFKKLKDNKYTSTSDNLEDYRQNLQKLASEFIETGQYKSLEKIAFLMKCVDKEKELVKLGVNQYVFRDDIDEFLSRRDIEKSDIRLIELSDYPRRIPKDIQKKIKETKNIFSHMYVMFTDYTGNVTKNHMREKEIKRKDKDPILFGTFQDLGQDSETFFNGDVFRRKVPVRLLNDQFYVIGDWVDEYCDLTLDKFIALSGKDDIVSEINSPVTIEEIEKAIKSFREVPEVE